MVKEELEAIRVDRQDLHALIERHPHAALDLLAATGRRLRQTVGLFRQTASRNVNEEVDDTRTTVQRTADWIAAFSGSLFFLFLHIIWFCSWILLNTSFASFKPLNRGRVAVPLSHSHTSFHV